MSIMIISGPPKSGKTLIANALRNNQIARGKGALIVDETTDGADDALLEKIIVGVPLAVGVEAAEQPWKEDAMIILIGNKRQKLEDFEKLAPGFRKLHGPVYTITTGAQT